MERNTRKKKKKKHVSKKNKNEKKKNNMESKSPTNGPLLTPCPPRPENQNFTKENRPSYSGNFDDFCGIWRKWKNKRKENHGQNKKLKKKKIKEKKNKKNRKNEKRQKETKKNMKNTENEKNRKKPKEAPDSCPQSRRLRYLPWCRYLAAQEWVEPQLYADNLECVSRDPGLRLRAARFTTGFVRLVGQEHAPSKHVLMSTSRTVRDDNARFDCNG